MWYRAEVAQVLQLLLQEPQEGVGGSLDRCPETMGRTSNGMVAVLAQGMGRKARGPGVQWEWAGEKGFPRYPAVERLLSTDLG